LPRKNRLRKASPVSRKAGKSLISSRERAPGKSNKSVCWKKSQGCSLIAIRSSATKAAASLRGRLTRAPSAPIRVTVCPPPEPKPFKVCTSMMLCSRGSSASSPAWASPAKFKPFKPAYKRR